MKKILLLIIMAGFMFRLSGLGHGLLTGETYHPDAPKQIRFLRRYLTIGYELDCSGADYYGYPTFHIHLAEWIYRGVRFFAHTIGYRNWKMGHMNQFLLVRLMLAMMSTATIYFVYRICAFLFNPAVGLLSSLFFAIHPFSISLAHFAVGDTAMVFFAVISAFYFSRALKENSLSNYILAGTFAGFSTAAKYNGIFIIILGIFPLFCNRRRAISLRMLVLAASCAGGFIIGTPAVFVNFGEGIKSVFSFLNHVSHIGATGDAVRQKAIWIGISNIMVMFKNALGLFFLLISIISATWIFVRKRTASYVFILLFPFAYLCIAICIMPSMQPCHLLIIFPFLFILTGVFIYSIRRWKIIAYALTFILVSICSYSSLEEVFFFKHADTRTAAREWIYRNVPPSFRVFGSGYSIADPYNEYKGKRESGVFFVSSYLSGMPVPKKGILVKEISLENEIPIIIHRNPSLKIFMIPGKDIKKGFKIPLFSHSAAKEQGTGIVFLNGNDFGINPLRFQVRSSKNRELILVSEKTVERIGVSLTNSFTATVVRIKVGWKKMKISLAPNETKVVLFEHPKRGFPLTKYFYKVCISKGKDDSLVFVKIGTDSYSIGRLYYEAGQLKKTVGLDKKIKRDLKEEEYTGISAKALRDVNAIRFASEKLTSLRGEIVIDKESSSRECIAISCNDGEKNCIYGPYYGFAYGNFVARFRLKISDVSGSSKIKLDAAGRLGTKIIAERFLDPEETQGFINVELPFCIKTPAEILEFRTALTGKGKIVLDYVEVFPDIEMEAKLKQWNFAK